MKNEQTTMKENILNANKREVQSKYLSKKILIPLISGFILMGILASSVQFFNASKNPNATTQTVQINNTATPSPETQIAPNITDWNTYTNQTYGFSFKHPSNLKIMSNGDFGADLVDATADQSMVTPKDIHVRVSVSTSDDNFEKIYTAADGTSIPEQQHAQDATYTKVRSYTINGYLAFDYIYIVPGNQTEKSITTGTYINKHGSYIHIMTWDNDTKLIKNIIQTIEFMISDDETSAWNIYSNFGVKFKYPENTTIQEEVNGDKQYFARVDVNGTIINFYKELVDSNNVPPYKKTTITKTVRNITWKVVTPEITSMYCDAGECGKTASMYYTYHNGYEYGFVYGPVDHQPTVEQMLSTFTFIE